MEMLPILDKAKQKYFEAYPLKLGGPVAQNEKRNKRFEVYVN